ncbi:Gfo/Idh/MocA family oxidoreductase [Nitrospina gracilis]|uniref:Gfo/Idh/MocA family oxidoreductase n=1 Tax=Nitrospina gracilis TaxID=35801 RepID=UPI001F327E7D|nr:Gfo/Idh/MocA family oxidoreductase [Nitrospina gracilis]MCF8719545.1 putative dehydrogenase [Nitrospina gracilis Nb-211]
MEALRAGVVGIGKMGQYHVGVLSEMRDIKLTHIADVNEDRCREISNRYGLTAVADYKDLFGQVDMVVVAVPTALHYPVTKDFLKAGIHVLLEKPCATNLEHARELFDLAEKNKLILHIGHVERFNGAVQELHKLVHEPIFVECKRMGPFNQRIKDDGVVLDIMIHDIDILLNLMQSKVVQTNVMGTSVFTERDDLVNVQMEFENGCMANIIASRASQNKIRTLSVTQKESYILLDYTDQEIYVHRQTSSEHQLSKDALRYKQESLIERIFVHKDNPLKLELQHFLDCVQNGTPRNVAVDKELYSLEIALNIVDMFNKQRNGK